MVNPDRLKLTGRDEVDESYIGGPEKGKRGRRAKGKNLVVGAIEVREWTGPKAGKVRLLRRRLRTAEEALRLLTLDEGQVLEDNPQAEVLTLAILHLEGAVADDQGRVAV